MTKVVGRWVGTEPNVQNIERSSVLAARPFLKWAGGKTQLLPELLARIPATFKHYHEPFVGGGAMFFALISEGFIGRRVKAVLNDANTELIMTYAAIRDDVDAVIAILKHHDRQFTKGFSRHYHVLRNVPEVTYANGAARMIALNKSCFNGLYRVNLKGEFNVPVGTFKSPPMICDEANLRACSAALQGVIFTAGDFISTRYSQPARGDFVYFDPPYVPLTSTSNFTSYTSSGFGPADQERLADYYRTLDARGVKVMLSNAEVPFVKRLYKSFSIEVVQARRSINSKGDKRGPIGEMIIRNYK